MPLYHYTSGEVINQIAEHGLLMNAPKMTVEGLQLGIYVTTDPIMNFFETLPDTKFDRNIEIYRIELDEKLFDSALLDREFHNFEIDEELELFGVLMMYIPFDIKPHLIEDIIKIENHQMRPYSLFGEI